MLVVITFIPSFKFFCIHYVETMQPFYILLQITVCTASCDNRLKICEKKSAFHRAQCERENDPPLRTGNGKEREQVLKDRLIGVEKRGENKDFCRVER